jgi:hypothetical protein
MISKLQTLRSQLASLRRSRQWFRWGTGWSAALVALLWILAGIFVLDVIFELEVLQRAVVIVVGLALLAWAVTKFTTPYLGQRETDIDMALMVERQQGIDSDLVAALQFESSPEAAKWGSRELEDAVIDYVAQLDRGLNVFEGFSRETFWKRFGLLVVSLGVVIAFAIAAPNYARVFLNRLALGTLHYPSDTQIKRVIVNGAEVLQQETHGTAPVDTKSAQGQSVLFTTWATGKLPTPHEKQFIYLYSAGPSSSRKVELSGVTRKELEGLYEQQLQLSATEHAAAPAAKGEAERLAGIVASITPASASEAGDSIGVAARLKQIINQWPKDEAAQLYVGKLPRLLDEVKFQVYLGDAWTDPATIKMVGLPVVVPTFTDILPDYARAAAQEENAQANDPASLQRSVIEGSTILVGLTSSKPLKSATLTMIDSSEHGEPDALSLKRDPNSKEESWTLPVEGTPLADIRGPVRFELQVVDEDDLSLESPLRGYVRLKADRPPRISGGLVHRVVLPTATPEIELRASDDFGIAAIDVRVDVTHRESNRTTAEAKDQAKFRVVKLLPLRGTMSPKEAESRSLQTIKFPLRGQSVSGAYVLDISSMQLARGDEVRITLLAEDYRGEKPGVVSESEPIVLEITDESGILAAVSEGDRRSQEQIDDLIRRQLGIGETPQ